VELLDRGAKRAAGRERSDMNLQKCRILPGPPAPSVRAPFESIMIDDLARAEHVLRLEVRGRVRDLYFAIDTILVERAAPRAGHGERVPAVGLRLHRIGPIQHHFDALGGRSPEAEGDSAAMQLCAKAHAGRHGDPENTRIDRGRACNFEPAANSAPSRGSGAVSKSVVQ